MKTGTKVLVTTSHRGVFFGTLEEQAGNTVVLKNARNCIYWSEETKGFLGLSAMGPQEGSRLGAVTPEVELFDVTSVSACTDDAIKAWESFS